MGRKKGFKSIILKNPPSIVATASIVGPKEGQGPLNKYFDTILSDNLYKEKSWEKAERKMLVETVKMAIENSKLPATEIEYFISGDLLNQIISSSFAARKIGLPFLGLYGACSAIAQGFGLGAILVDSGYAKNVAVASSSHFCTAERQFRFPLELGNQRPPTSQWTVTGAGAAIISDQSSNPKITHITFGKVVDMGSSNVNDMGAAMAPAASDTIARHFEDTGRNPKDYDLIISGDLASIGTGILTQLLKKEGYDVSKNLSDCGLLIFSPEQDVHAGGSGCGCAAVVTCGYLFKEMKKGKYTRVLLVGTGALLSTTSSQQGDTIPCIAHAIAIENL